jgi:HK97 family phage prohead protease
MNDEIKLPDGIETRFLKLEVRAEKRADQKPVIKGQAAVFNQETIIRGWFREQIKPGAFQQVLSDSPDAIGCFNHDWNIVLGRTTAGTLDLQETPSGLDYEIEINPDDSEAMSVYAKVARGDVSQSSFAFQVGKEEWVYPPDNSTDLPLRNITEFSKLYDVCPATFGAYPQTTAAVRSIFQAENEEPVLQPQAASSDTEEIKARQVARRRKLDLIERSVAK